MNVRKSDQSLIDSKYLNNLAVRYRLSCYYDIASENGKNELDEEIKCIRDNLESLADVLEYDILTSEGYERKLICDEVLFALSHLTGDQAHLYKFNKETGACDVIIRHKSFDELKSSMSESNQNSLNSLISRLQVFFPDLLTSVSPDELEDLFRYSSSEIYELTLNPDLLTGNIWISISGIKYVLENNGFSENE